MEIIPWRKTILQIEIRNERLGYEKSNLSFIFILINGIKQDVRYTKGGNVTWKFLKRLE